LGRDGREKEVMRSIHSYGNSSRGRGVTLHCLILQKTNLNPTTDKNRTLCLKFLVFLREVDLFNFCYEQNIWDFFLHLQIFLLMPGFWLGIEFVFYQTEIRTATHYTMTFTQIICKHHFYIFLWGSQDIIQNSHSQSQNWNFELQAGYGANSLHKANVGFAVTQCMLQLRAGAYLIDILTTCFQTPLFT